MARSKEELDAFLERERDAIEAAEFGPDADTDSDAPLPDHVTVTRGGSLRSKTVQARVAPEEYDAIEALARQRGVTVSTLVRDVLVSATSQPATGRVDLVNLLDNLEAQLMYVRSELVAGR